MGLIPFLSPISIVKQNVVETRPPHSRSTISHGVLVAIELQRRRQPRKHASQELWLVWSDRHDDDRSRSRLQDPHDYLRSELPDLATPEGMEILRYPSNRRLKTLISM